MGKWRGGEAARQRAWGRTQPTSTPRDDAMERLRTDAVRAGFDPCELDGDMTEGERLALDGMLGFDPDCRFARDGFELGLHSCTDANGHLVRPGVPCHVEARTQIAEQGRRSLASASAASTASPSRPSAGAS